MALKRLLINREGNIKLTQADPERSVYKSYIKKGYSFKGWIEGWNTTCIDLNETEKVEKRKGEGRISVKEMFDIESETDYEVHGINNHSIDVMDSNSSDAVLITVDITNLTTKQIIAKLNTI